MDIEDALADIERRALRDAAGPWLASLDELRRLVALGDEAAIRAFMVGLPQAYINAGALSTAAADAWTEAGTDAGAIVARTTSTAERRVIADRVKRPPTVDLSDLWRDALAAQGQALALLQSGVDPSTAAAGLLGNARATRGRVVDAIHGTAAQAATTVARTARKPVVWVAERNACVACLAHSGLYVQPGQTFPAVTYGAKVYHEATKAAPLHPHCRCHLEPLNDVAYAEALRREADRSVLRGYSLESESMRVRVDAAERLIQRGVDAPKSVIAVGERAVKNGRFPTRVVPKTRPGGDGPPPRSQPRTDPPKPPTGPPPQPRTSISRGSRPRPSRDG